MLPTSPRTLLLAGLLATSAVVSRAAWAVDVLATSDLSTQDDGTIRIPIHDADFGDWVKAKVSTEVGRVGSAVPRGGAVEVSWTPPEDFAGGAVEFRVRYKDAKGTKQDKTFSLDVPAAATVPIELTAEPAVVAPDVEQVTLKWTAPPSGQAPSERRYRLAASAGQLGPVRVAEDGTATATWRRPPGVETPVMALITLVDEADARRRGRLALPVQVTRSTTFQVPSDAKVSVQLGDETMGPKQASPAGTVAFDLRLDPRVKEGHLTGRTPHGDEVDQRVELPEVAAPAIVLALPARARVNTAAIPVAAAVWSPDGDARAALTVDTGKLTLQEQADGWLTGTWGPQPDTVGAVTVTATVGEEKVKDQVTVAAGVPSVAASADPAQLTATQRDVTVSAKPVDALQRPVSDTVGVQVVDGVLTARASRRGDTTTARVRKNRGVDTIVVLAQPPGSVAREPVNAVVPWLVPLDEDHLLLRVAVVDSAGRAIAGVPVEVDVRGTAPEGLPGSLTTDGYGMAHFKMARPDGALGLQLSAGGHSGGVAIAPDGTPLAGGDAEWLRLQQVWMASAPTLVVSKKAAVAVAAVVPPTAAPPPDAPATADAGSPSPAPTEPRPPREPDGRAWLRASIALQGTALTYGSSTEDSAVGPLTATVEEAGITGGGLAAHILAWPGSGAIGLEADVRYDQATLTPALTYGSGTVSTEDLEEVDDATDLEGVTTASTDAQTFERNALDLRLGLRYRAALAGPLEGYGLLQLHSQRADLFVWDGGVVTDAATPMLGARIGGGAMLEAGPAWVDVQIAETLAPYPIRFEVDGRVQANITPGLAIHAGGGMAWRTMVFTIDESELTVEDQQATFMVGLATSLR